MLLGVNIDHIAVLREARQVNDPDILMACYEAISGGADQITIHLREDRRHINEFDAKDIILHSKVPINLECSVNEDIINLVCKLKPLRATLVPERREELTTEGGLNLKSDGLIKAIDKLQNNDIDVSLFIDPKRENIDISKELGVEFVELHTGAFANAYLMLTSNLKYTKYSIKTLEKSKPKLEEILKEEIQRIKHTSSYAKGFNIKVAAGHGLNYQNVKYICKIPEIFELNIGQSIVAKSVFSGLKCAVEKMREIINA